MSKKSGGCEQIGASKNLCECFAQFHQNLKPSFDCAGCSSCLWDGLVGRFERTHSLYAFKADLRALWKDLLASPLGLATDQIFAHARLLSLIPRAENLESFLLFLCFRIFGIFEIIRENLRKTYVLISSTGSSLRKSPQNLRKKTRRKTQQIRT